MHFLDPVNDDSTGPTSEDENGATDTFNIWLDADVSWFFAALRAPG